MTLLQSLPAELICQILGYLQPTTKLHEYHIAEEQRWDVRHWGRTLAAVARTCRTLHAIATPLLYSRYEAAFHSPVIPFIDRSTVENPRHQGVRHVAIRTDGTTNDKYTPTPERVSEHRIWARDFEVDSDGLSGTTTLTSEDAAQMELWRLISQAPNLETLSVTVITWRREYVCSDDQPPVWIFPVVSAAQSVQTDLKYSGWFHKLHTLSFNMHGQCGTWLIQLLSLPCLKSLSLGSWGIQPYDDWEVSLVWPETTATSGVRDLSFGDTSVPADVIVRVADYCMALESFRCYRAWDNRAGADERGRQWCGEILAGLQRHSQTLTSLVLYPSDRHYQWNFDKQYGRLRGFETLVALNSLDVPWHVIMGSPVGIKNEDGHWVPVGDFRYPNLHDVLPKNLRHLRFNKTERSTPGCAGIEQALSSALPFLDAEGNGLLLNKIGLFYNGARCHKPLPMNFWRMQDAFQKAGVKFEYKFKLDPEDFCKPCQISTIYLLTLKHGGSMAKAPSII